MKPQAPAPREHEQETGGKTYRVRYRAGRFGTFHVRVRVTRDGTTSTIDESIVRGADKARAHALAVITRDFWAHRATERTPA